MTGKDQAIRRFLRAAAQRLATAEFLIENKLEQYPLDAVYLGGYAVECSLKAVILQWTSESTFQKTYDEITRGKRGHSFESLLETVRRRNCPIPDKIVRCLRTVNWWTSDLRYETRIVRVGEAKTFWTAAREVLRWAENK